MAPSSYEAVRVILKVEYSRIDRTTSARTEVNALIMIIGTAKVTESSKLGSNPGGGGIDGV